MARARAMDLGPYNITVNCLAPGPFATDLPMSILSAEQQAALAARTALESLGTPGRVGRSRPALGQRGGQLHHRRRAGG